MAQDLSAYVPEVWAQEALAQRAQLTDISRLVTYRGAEFLPVGDTYKVSVIQSLVTSAIPTAPGSEITTQDITASTVDLLVNNWNTAALTIKGKDSRQAIQSAWESEYIKESMRALTDEINAKLAAEVANAGVSLNLSSYSSIDRALIEVRKRFNGNKVPMTERYGVVSNDVGALLLQVDKYFTAASVMGKSKLLSAGVLSDDGESPMPGFLGTIYGINIFESGQVVESGSPLTAQSMFFHRSAIMFLEQTSPTFNEDSVWYEKKEKATYIAPEVLYGVKTMRANHMIRLNSVV